MEEKLMEEKHTTTLEKPKAEWTAQAAGLDTGPCSQPRVGLKIILMIIQCLMRENTFKWRRQIGKSVPSYYLSQRGNEEGKMKLGV